MQVNELREYQVGFEKIRSDVISDANELFELRKIFTKDFSKERINSLSIDEFVSGKGSPSFCNRIENDLNDWGNIHGSTAKKFGLYYGVLGKDKVKKYRIGKAIFGSSVDKAFKNVKSYIVELLENNNDLDLLKTNPISPMFKGKILSVYYPEKFLNIFSARHLNHFINYLSLENNSKSELDKQNKLLEFKQNDLVMKHWSIFEFSKFLYESFGSPNNEINDSKLANELKGFKLKDFPPIETVKFEFIDLETDEAIDSNSNSRKKSKKIDYSSQSKKFKRIGDRGEQIVVMAERQILTKNKRHDLAQKVDQISIRDDYVGYDIQSYDIDGKVKYIEVKSTIKPVGFSNIFISANELEVAECTKNYYFYIVYNVADKTPKIWKIESSKLLSDENIKLKPDSYSVHFNTKEKA